jgi:uncharacterized protein
MFLEKRSQSHNSVLLYLLGFFIISISYVLGQIPLGIAVTVKTLTSGAAIPTTEAEMMQLFSPNVTLFLMLLIFVFTMIGIILVVKYIHKMKLIDIITNRDTIDWKRVFFCFGIWSLFTIGTLAALYFYSPDSFVYNFKPTSFFVLLLIGVIMIPIQTSAEEFIFRGYLMQGFGLLAKNRWFPLITTSLLFGLMHIMNPEIEKLGYIMLVYYIGTGLFLGMITLLDDGMELALGFHAANNLVGALLVSADWTVLQTDSILKDISEPSALRDIVLPMAIIYPLILFILHKKYKWKNWTEKLTGKITFETPNTL